MAELRQLLELAFFGHIDPHVDAFVPLLIHESA